MGKVNIWSIKECDESFGDGIVCYTVGDYFKGYCFVEYDYFMSLEEQVYDHYMKNGGKKGFPNVSELSENLKNLINVSDFEMFFVEEDDFSEDQAYEIFEETQKWKSLNGAITYEEDSSILTVYAGAMCCVNWM